MGIQLAKPSLDVGIVTRDFDRMMSFYRDALGFPAEEPAVFPGVGSVHRLKVGDSVLRLLQPEQLPPASGLPNEAVHSATGFRYITLLVRDMDGALEACRRFGATVARPPKEVRPGVVVATVQDPDGNWIELQTR
jgi:catechol 2,3-dioxygenase-like lactoylglutathione lyase family enzyme